MVCSYVCVCVCCSVLMWIIYTHMVNDSHVVQRLYYYFVLVLSLHCRHQNVAVNVCQSERFCQMVSRPHPYSTANWFVLMQLGTDYAEQWSLLRLLLVHASKPSISNNQYCKYGLGGVQDQRVRRSERAELRKHWWMDRLAFRVRVWHTHARCTFVWRGQASAVTFMPSSSNKQREQQGPGI